jgi:hypothetical protein
MVPFLLLVAALGQGPIARPQTNACPELVAGKPISVVNSPTRPACITVSVARGEALQVIADYLEDVALHVSGSGREFPVHGFEFGRETVTLSAAGQYRIEIRPIGKTPKNARRTIKMSLNPLPLQAATTWEEAELDAKNSQGKLLSGRVYSYDSLGRLTNNSQCTPQNCGAAVFPVAYSYDLVGDALSATNGVGVTFNYSYDTAARLSGMTSSFVDANHPATLYSNLQYNALGGLTASSLGSALNEVIKWDCRGRILAYASAIPPATPSPSISNTLGCANITAINIVPEQNGLAGPFLRAASFGNPARLANSILLSGLARPSNDHGSVLITLATPDKQLSPAPITVSYAEGETALSVARRVADEINGRKVWGFTTRVRELKTSAILELMVQASPSGRQLSTISVSVTSNRKIPSIRATALGPPQPVTLPLGEAASAWTEGQ